VEIDPAVSPLPVVDVVGHDGEKGQGGL
jgi:hypothetical protein